MGVRESARERRGCSPPPVVCARGAGSSRAAAGGARSWLLRAVAAPVPAVGACLREPIPRSPRSAAASPLRLPAGGAAEPLPGERPVRARGVEGVMAPCALRGGRRRLGFPPRGPGRGQEEGAAAGREGGSLPLCLRGSRGRPPPQRAALVAVCARSVRLAPAASPRPPAGLCDAFAPSAAERPWVSSRSPLSSGGSCASGPRAPRLGSAARLAGEHLLGTAR
ncbi:uncharacterized protein C10orf95-like [Melopsittacus undulatus]|uniref:uncharacterized protein C10orf95-like n=1 Tax=Melopsittacus undulatus TaxID=13146 RepID=UPI00146DD7D7|nr:uncharacterized protein C10orf95-like [Melopsittacus undulatus]